MALVLQTLTSRLALDDGTDSDGRQRTVNVSLGDMSEARWDDTTSPAKLLAVASAIEPILTRDLVRVEIVATSRLTSN